MNLFRISALMLPLAASSAWAAADPQLLNTLMPPEAKVIAGVQMDQAKAAPFGQFMLTQMGVSTQFDQIKAATGFDPRTDLSEIVAGSTGDGKILIAGHGAFQATRVANLAAMAGAVTEDYRGISLLKAPTTVGAEENAVAFLDGSTVVLGDRTQVKAAVDRWIAAVRSTGGLMDRAAAVSASSQAWGVATGLTELAGKQAAGAAPQAAAMQNLLSSVDQIAGGLTFGGTDIAVHGQAFTRSSQDAQALADVLRFIIGMAMPQASLAGLPQLDVPQFDVQGSAVSFSLSIPEAQAESLLKPPAAQARMQPKSPVVPRAAARR
ncbi:MAG: hypothetical protein ABI811_23735 [Acidobacteriota bacterium]